MVQELSSLAKKLKAAHSNTKYPSLYAYPAVFAYTPELDGWLAHFPDFPEITNCVARTLSEAMLEARYTLEDLLYRRERDETPVLVPTALSNVQHDEGEIVQLIVADMPPIRRAYNQKAVKKTLTIPAWMEDELKKHPDLNVSRILQDALKRELNLEEPN